MFLLSCGRSETNSVSTEKNSSIKRIVCNIFCLEGTFVQRGTSDSLRDKALCDRGGEAIAVLKF